MAKASTKYENISKIVLTIISLLLSLFLIALGNKILNDITNIYSFPSKFNSTVDSVLNAETNKLNDNNLEITSLIESKERFRIAFESANSNYNSQKQSFDNWIRTRKTLGSPQQDNEVLAQTKKLDEIKIVRDKWQNQLFEIEQSILKLENKEKVIKSNIDKINIDLDERYAKEIKSYDLKVFFIRLLFALPILAFGVFLVIKYRKGKYKSFVWGYSIFSLYVFFIGLVPYMPSYGGYVRYIVGVILTLFIGYYVIKQLTIYTERKKNELSKSKEERSKEIVYEKAILAFETRTCPSCERKVTKVIGSSEKEPNFCIHCGLKLFGDCVKCGQRNYVHFPHCSSCGTDISVENTN